MKFKTTKKEMRDNYYIIGAGYCSMQYLLYYKNPIAYSSGVYGWACDYYDIDGVIISTGYSYIASKNTKASYELIKEYELKAEKIIYNHNLKYDTKKKKVNKLLNDLIAEALQ